MSNGIVKIVQLTDTHLFSDTKGTLLGVNTEASFQAVLQLLNGEKGSLDFIIHTGDMTQDQSPASYLRLATALKQMNTPVYFVPGNHDDTNVLSRVYPCENMVNDKHILLSSWQCILLNSQKQGSVEGYLGTSELDFLRSCLEDYPSHHALIVFHHQPVPVGSQWLDQLGLSNAAEFWQTISSYSNVKAVFFGHVHQESEHLINGIPCYSTPSTCIQFKHHQDHFGLEKLPPGYRWIHLHDNGKVETGVHRTPHYVGSFEVDAKGY